MRSNRVIKIIAATCFISIAIAVLVAWNSPATGYEASIYTATPLLVWIFLGLSTVCGIGIIIHQIYTKQHEISKQWVIGLLLILFSYIAILSLHIIGGYAFWCASGDPATHFGEVKNIITSGHTAGRYVYPIAHILAAQLSQVCDLAPVVSLRWLPVLFALIYVGFMH